MTQEQIETLFFEVIQEKAIYNKTDCFTENQIYNWRKKRTKPTIGDMLGLLYQLKKVEVKKNISDDFDEYAKGIASIKSKLYTYNKKGELEEIHSIYTEDSVDTKEMMKYTMSIKSNL